MAEPMRDRALELLSDASYRRNTPSEKRRQGLVAMNGSGILDELVRSGAPDRGSVLDTVRAVLRDVGGEDGSYSQDRHPSPGSRLARPGPRVELFYVPKTLLATEGHE